MTIDRHRAVEPSSSSWSTAEGSSTRTGPRLLAAFAAVLAATVLMLGGTSAAAAPTFNTQFANTGTTAGSFITIGAFDAFDNSGTNARFTDVEFSSTEWYSDSGITNGRIFVQVKTADDLNALASPPPTPFTVTATATMTNDEGETASGTFTFTTYYAREESTTPVVAKPTFNTQFANVGAFAGWYITVNAEDNFDNAGTNPRFTEVTFSTTEWYSDSGITNGGSIFVKVKTADELNAMAEPPPNPFTVTATATMTNDEGQTATGTFTFETRYARTESATPAIKPVIVPDFIKTLSAGGNTTLYAAGLFQNVGTNPRLTSVSFSTMEYFRSGSGLNNGAITVLVKSAADLSALADPPSSPFTVTATVEMTNDEGETATGTISYKITYVEPSPPPPPPEGLTPKQLAVLNVPPGSDIFGTTASAYFHNVGTNARLTGATFSTLDYYKKSDTGIWGGKLYMVVKTAAQLKALASPPPSPFTVDVTLTMTNDEGETATNTLTIQTTYDAD